MVGKARALFCAALLCSAAASAQDKETAASAAKANAEPAIILLGTAGGPRIRADRSQPATAIVANGKTYLFDIGYGTLGRLAQADLPLPAVEAVFITHNHFDHNADLGPLIAFSWHAARQSPLRIYGPPGMREVVEQALGAFRHSIEIFNSETPRPPPQIDRDVIVIEAKVGSPVFSDPNVKVTARENSHFRHLIPGSPAYGRDLSYAYRIETSAGSVVVSGDTGPNDELSDMARGADVLVAETLDEPAVRTYVAAWAARDRLSEKTAAETLAHMVDGHLSGDDVAKLATTSGVCRLVLTHLVPSATGNLERVAAEIRAVFSGDVVAGSDLMRIPVRCKRP